MLQKALLSVTARERAQLWDFDCRGGGALQKALISVTAHEYMQKTFSILPYLAVRGECALRGRCALRKARHSVKVYTRNCTNLVKIPQNDHISTQDETKTENNGLLCMVLAILAQGGTAAKKHYVPQRYLKPYTSSDSFRN